jgi:hypothetical protein
MITFHTIGTSFFLHSQKIQQIFRYINLLNPTGHVMHQHSTTVRSAHTVFMYFVFISEQTATLEVVA